MSLLSIETLVSQLPPNTIKTLLLVLVPTAIWYLFIRQDPTEKPVTFEWKVPPEASPEWQGQVKLSSPSIDSHLDLSSSLLPTLSPITPERQFITTWSPTTNTLLSIFPSMSPNEIREAITRAEEAQKGWKETTWAQRRKVLRSLLKWVERDMDGIVQVACRDTGKTMVDAAFGEILTTCEKLRWTIENGEKYLKDEPRGTNLLLAHKKSWVRYEPLGVVAGVVSWNYPFHNLISPIISALMTGNSILLKPSELVLWSSTHYILAIRSCLSECGFDPDVVQGVYTRAESVEALTGDERLGHITFIGSERVGQKVALKAAEVGTPVLLELGGKDPCIILESADLGFFQHTWMRAAFQAAGQNCIGTERFLVHASLYPSVLSLVTPMVKSLRLGTDVGAMVSPALLPRLEELIDEAVKEGAEVIVGGKKVSEEEKEGSWFEPTLIVGVKEDMRIAREELFAPIMLVMSVSSTTEAIKIANGTRYGLGASVFGRNKEECRRCVRELRCGMVCTNDFGVFYLNQSLPFGGTKSSGHGRFAGPEGLRGLCNLKAITEDRFHGIIQTGIPPRLRYPIKDADGAWRFVKGLVGVVYGSWSGVGKAIAGLVW
ncbi:ALDH-like protein [Meredithblackwellia eburnea MCA 4105]